MSTRRLLIADGAYEGLGRPGALSASGQPFADVDGRRRFDRRWRGTSTTATAAAMNALLSMDGSMAGCSTRSSINDVHSERLVRSRNDNRIISSGGARTAVAIAAPRRLRGNRVAAPHRPAATASFARLCRRRRAASSRGAEVLLQDAADRAGSPRRYIERPDRLARLTAAAARQMGDDQPTPAGADRAHAPRFCHIRCRAPSARAGAEEPTS